MKRLLLLLLCIGIYNVAWGRYTPPTGGGNISNVFNNITVNGGDNIVTNLDGSIIVSNNVTPTVTNQVVSVGPVISDLGNVPVINFPQRVLELFDGIGSTVTGLDWSVYGQLGVGGSRIVNGAPGISNNDFVTVGQLTSPTSIVNNVIASLGGYGVTNNTSVGSPVFPRFPVLYRAVFTPSLGDPTSRTAKDFRLFEAVSRDGLNWSNAGRPPMEFNGDNDSDGCDCPSELFYTNSVYPNGIFYINFARNLNATNFVFEQISSDWQHWLPLGNGTNFVQGGSGTNITWVGRTFLYKDATNLLHRAMNVFTNFNGNQWANFEQHITDGTLTNWSTPLLMSGNGNFAASSSAYDPCILPGISGTNWWTYSTGNQFGIGYSTTSLTTGFTDLGTISSVNSGGSFFESPTLVTNNSGGFNLWVDTHAGWRLFTASNPAGPYAVSGTQTFPYWMRCGSVQQCSFDVEQAMALSSQFQGAPLDYVARAAELGSDVVTNGRATPFNVNGILVVSGAVTNNGITVPNGGLYQLGFAFTNNFTLTPSQQVVIVDTVNQTVSGTLSAGVNPAGATTLVCLTNAPNPLIFRLPALAKFTDGSTIKTATVAGLYFIRDTRTNTSTAFSRFQILGPDTAFQLGAISNATMNAMGLVSVANGIISVPTNQAAASTNGYPFLNSVLSSNAAAGVGKLDASGNLSIGTNQTAGTGNATNVFGIISNSFGFVNGSGSPGSALLQPYTQLVVTNSLTTGAGTLNNVYLPSPNVPATGIATNVLYGIKNATTNTFYILDIGTLHVYLDLTDIDGANTPSGYPLLPGQSIQVYFPTQTAAQFTQFGVNNTDGQWFSIAGSPVGTTVQALSNGLIGVMLPGLTNLIYLNSDLTGVTISNLTLQRVSLSTNTATFGTSNVAFTVGSTLLTNPSIGQAALKAKVIFNLVAGAGAAGIFSNLTTGEVTPFSQPGGLAMGITNTIYLPSVNGSEIIKIIDTSPIGIAAAQGSITSAGAVWKF